MRLWFVFVVSLTVGLYTKAQDSLRVSKETALRSKGLIIDLGLNHFYSRSDNRLALDVLSSRGANVYLFNKINPQAQHIQFRIGFGVGLDNYAFKKDIYPVPFQDSTFFVVGNSVDVDSIEFIKSKMSLNHFDIPVEVVFQTRDAAGALKLALGMRLGWVFDMHAKRVTEVNGFKQTEKLKADFNIQRMRVSLSARLMYRGINLFFMHNLTPVFQKDRGPNLPNYMFGFFLFVN